MERWQASGGQARVTELESKVRVAEQLGADACAARVALEKQRAELETRVGAVEAELGDARAAAEVARAEAEGLRTQLGARSESRGRRDGMAEELGESRKEVLACLCVYY